MSTSAQEEDAETGSNETGSDVINGEPDEISQKRNAELSDKSKSKIPIRTSSLKYSKPPLLQKASDLVLIKEKTKLVHEKARQRQAALTKSLDDLSKLSNESYKPRKRIRRTASERNRGRNHRLAKTDPIRPSGAPVIPELHYIPPSAELLRHHRAEDNVHFDDSGIADLPSRKRTISESMSVLNDESLHTRLSMVSPLASKEHR